MPRYRSSDNKFSNQFRLPLLEIVHYILLIICSFYFWRLLYLFIASSIEIIHLSDDFHYLFILFLETIIFIYIIFIFIIFIVLFIRSVIHLFNNFHYLFILFLETIIFIYIIFIFIIFIFLFIRSIIHLFNNFHYLFILFLETIIFIYCNRLESINTDTCLQELLSFFGR